MSRYKGKFESLELSIYRMAMEIACDIFRTLLEEYDKEIRRTREKGRYKNLGLKKQNIKTMFGEVKYKRHLYYDREKNNYIFMLDECLELEKMGNFSLNLVDRVCNLITEVSYREVQEQLSSLCNLSLTHQSIWNLVQKIGGGIFEEYKRKAMCDRAAKIKTDLLFEEHDGVYLKSQEDDNKHGFEVKVGTFYTGWEEKEKARYSLLNKTVFAAAIPVENFIAIKEGIADFTYDIRKVKYRIMNCDGAGWTFNDSDSTAIKQLDFFHIKQAIFFAISDKAKQQELFSFLREKKYNAMLNRISDYIKNCSEGSKKDRLTSLYNYLYNHKNELHRYQDRIKYDGNNKLRNMGIQENQNYIVITRRMKHRRMSWSRKGASNLAIIVCDRINQETWDNTDDNCKQITLNEEVLLSATLHTVDKLKKVIIPKDIHGVNDRIINDMIERLGKISLA